MRNTIQTIGMVIAIIIACIGYGSTIYHGIKQNLSTWKMCEKLTLSEDGSKIFYVDKKTNEIWAVELNNKYLLKEIGRFPNTSKIAYSSTFACMSFS